VNAPAKQKPKAKGQKPAKPPVRVTYSVGDWVWARRGGASNPRRRLARIESAVPLPGRRGDLWLVRIYIASRDRTRAPLASHKGERQRLPPRGGHWSAGAEKRYVHEALKPGEVAEFRRLGIIPPAGEPLPTPPPDPSAPRVQERYRPEGDEAWPDGGNDGEVRAHGSDGPDDGGHS
jgi:hypothetical protein